MKKKIILVVATFLLLSGLSYAWFTGVYCAPDSVIATTDLIRAKTECQTYKNYSCCWRLLKQEQKPKDITGCYFMDMKGCTEYLGPKMIEWTKTNKPEFLAAAQADLEEMYLYYGIGVVDPPPDPVLSQCSDGKNNDTGEDFLVDMADPGCSSPEDDSESPNPETPPPDPDPNPGDCSACEAELSALKTKIQTIKDELQTILNGIGD
jgi:hypothetical protein